jgi:hypothetical protein
MAEIRKHYERAVEAHYVWKRANELWPSYRLIVNHTHVALTEGVTRSMPICLPSGERASLISSADMKLCCSFLESLRRDWCWLQSMKHKWETQLASSPTHYEWIHNCIAMSVVRWNTHISKLMNRMTVFWAPVSTFVFVRKLYAEYAKQIINPSMYGVYIHSFFMQVNDTTIRTVELVLREKIQLANALACPRCVNVLYLAIDHACFDLKAKPMLNASSVSPPSPSSLPVPLPLPSPILSNLTAPTTTTIHRTTTTSPRKLKRDWTHMMNETSSSVSSYIAT